ncbi:extracellular solute-binding protein, partial [Klebsiella pneumoniae]|uniref:extracellular solute-binding protein n=1 Tax=Klebsiella pneumoniae TaxID=573 RepID=UPI003D65F9F2
MGYPIGGTEVTFIAYNKEIFRNAGIDVENNPPQTYDDFFSVCEAISGTGVTPIVASSDGWNELYLQVFSKRWVQYSGDAAIISMA